MMMSMEKRPVFRGAKAQAAETPSWTAPTWQELVRDHSAQVHRLAYRLTGNRPERLTLDEGGAADFLCRGGSVSVWAQDGRAE